MSMKSCSSNRVLQIMFGRNAEPPKANRYKSLYEMLNSSRFTDNSLKSAIFAYNFYFTANEIGRWN